VFDFLRRKNNAGVRSRFINRFELGFFIWSRKALHRDRTDLLTVVWRFKGIQ